MAITEHDYLLVRDLQMARTWMMLRGDRQFHLIRVDASLTEQKMERLMKRYPCGLKELQEMGLHVTPLNTERCTHVVFSGWKEGDQLELWLMGDIRRYKLGDTYDQQRLEAFFNTQQKRWDVPEEPDGPNERTTRLIGWMLNALSFSLLLLSLFGRGFPWTWTRWLGLAAFVISVGLCICWPGRFLTEELRERRENRRVYRVGMEFPIIVLPLVMVLDVLEHVTYCNGIALLAAGAVAGLLIGGALLWRSRAYRNHGIGLLIGLMILSAGVVAQVNQLLDFGPTTAHLLTVDQTEESRSIRGGTSYYCYVIMPDGEQEQFSISRTHYQELSTGDSITVISHDGALGMEYLTIQWDE